MVTSPKRSASPLPTRERIPVAHISEVEFGEPEIAENDYLSRLPDALAQRILAYVVKSSDDPKLQLCRFVPRNFRSLPKALPSLHKTTLLASFLMHCGGTGSLAFDTNRIAMVSRHWRLQASNRELWAPLVPQLAYFDSPNRTLRQAHSMPFFFSRLINILHANNRPLGRVNPNLNSPAATPYFEFSSLLVPGKENGSRTPATPALPPNSLSATLGFTPTPLRRPQRQIAPIVLHSAPMAPARAESPALSGTATGASNPSAIPASPATPRARQLRDSGSSRSATRPHSAAGSLARQRRRLHLS
ncbi:uncharacterized protein MONBRDRAFT_11816 [Monosiga brevicollis MX1]|uniref:F-box domain-containing protein n=1 Tax=Monosiga brevicollis TaxID=81824 RepID=A9VAC7_MONBE|nr:uncharacterized protein MONBRDRAFT_11816 [Monosiga brevicollis MX1]EDQ85518.1 predicted protein [Monosiga brevicollis MX1]|eukprot:XP_001749709.1 hypothetical protein [Monosiga brevicollis MX1]